MGVIRVKGYKILVLSMCISQSLFCQSKNAKVSPQEKISTFTKMLEKCNKCDVEYSGRGLAKEELGDYAGAVDDYRKMGEGYVSSLLICGALLKIPDYHSAIKEYTKMINSDIPIGLVASKYYDRAQCKFTLEDYRGAISDYNKAIELNPNEKLAYYNRGIAKYNLNQLDSACLDWSKAGELGFPEAYDLIRKYCN